MESSSQSRAKGLPDVRLPNNGNLSSDEANRVVVDREQKEGIDAPKPGNRNIWRNTQARIRVEIGRENVIAEVTEERQ